MWLLISSSAVLLTIFALALISRIHGNVTQVARFALLIVPIGGLLAVILLERYGFSPETIAGILIYILGCELYLFLFTMALGSVSANLLIHLSSKPYMHHQILKDYDGEYMVRRRLERLVGGGLLRQTANELELTAKGTNLLRIFDLLSRFFGFCRNKVIL